MGENGLAQQQSQAVALLEEVMAMLAQGVSPEELVAQGIPEEIVVQAMNELQVASGADVSGMPAQTASGAGMTQGAGGLAAQGL